MEESGDKWEFGWAENMRLFFLSPFPPPFVSYFVVFCHRLRRGNLARIIIYVCIILFMSMSTTIYSMLMLMLLHAHTHTHSPRWSNVVMLDILFLDLPFCIYFELMLPSMSFQCTVYIRVENFKAINISKCSQIVSLGIPLFHPQNRVRLVSVLVCSFFSTSYLQMHNKYDIKIALWATDIGIKCSLYVFGNQLWACDALNICISANLFVYRVPVRICTNQLCHGKFNMKIASIHKFEMKWSTMLNQILTPARTLTHTHTHSVLVFALQHFN